MRASQSRGRFWFSLTHIDKQVRRRTGFVCAPPVRFRSRRPGKLVPRSPQESSLLITQFSQFTLSPALLTRLTANKFELPTPVQAGAIPPALEGRDVLA